MLTQDQLDRLEKHYRPVLDLVEGRYVTAATLGERWNWSEQHLANLRRKPGEGPAFTVIGRSIRYPVSEVLAWEIGGHSAHVTPERVALAVSALPFDTETREKITAHLKGALFGAV